MSLSNGMSQIKSIIISIHWNRSSRDVRTDRVNKVLAFVAKINE